METWPREAWSLRRGGGQSHQDVCTVCMCDLRSENKGWSPAWGLSGWKSGPPYPAMDKPGGSRLCGGKAALNFAHLNILQF